MKNTEIFFPFEPIAKGRPKFTKTGHAYTPKKTREYEKKIADYYNSHTNDFYDSAIKIKLVFNMPIPKSITKKNRIAIITGQIKHIKRPDTDNLIKAVTDGLLGIAFSDDSLITKINATKQYAPDENVGTYMEISEDVE